MSEHFLKLAMMQGYLIWNLPPEPLEACRLMEDLSDRAHRLEIQAAALRNHAELLRELAGAEASERLSVALGVDQGQRGERVSGG